jgi:hypothetical protein
MRVPGMPGAAACSSEPARPPLLRPNPRRPGTKEKTVAEPAHRPLPESVPLMQSMHHSFSVPRKSFGLCPAACAIRRS